MASWRFEGVGICIFHGCLRGWIGSEEINQFLKRFCRFQAVFCFSLLEKSVEMLQIGSIHDSSSSQNFCRQISIKSQSKSFPTFPHIPLQTPDKGKCTTADPNRFVSVNIKMFYCLHSFPSSLLASFTRPVIVVWNLVKIYCVARSERCQVVYNRALSDKPNSINDNSKKVNNRRRSSL
jgi:hypothetical protein